MARSAWCCFTTRCKISIWCGRNNVCHKMS